MLLDSNKKNYFDILTKMGDVLLVDVMNHLHRFLWVNKDLSVTIGDEEVVTGHIYGFLRYIIFLRDRFPNSSIILVLDGKDKERVKLNPEYKSGRDRSVNMYKDIPDIVDFASLLDGVYYSYNENFEADDTICSLSHIMTRLCKVNNIKKDIYILSNDKDMYQLVYESSDVNVRIIRKFGKGSRWMDDADLVGIDGVRTVFNGVYPDDLVKFRAITGDSSDRLKGYYRFRKSNAAIIAENFDYDLDSRVFTLKEGKAFDDKWKGFMNILGRDMSVFDTNYRIMKMKDYKAIIEKRDCSDRIQEIMNKLEMFKLKQFPQKVVTKKYSKYHNEIYRYLTNG